MMDHYYAVIMAGGGGTRLWPLSRQARPKQVLSLIEEDSLFQGAVKRYGIQLPDRELVCAPFDSPEGQRYLGAMKAAANYAFCNRQVLAHHIRRSCRGSAGRPGGALGPAPGLRHRPQHGQGGDARGRRPAPEGLRPPQGRHARLRPRIRRAPAPVPSSWAARPGPQRQDVLLGFALFFVLALGLGLPYLVLALSTRALERLPNSGAWMLGVRQMFGVLLVAMAAWFVRPFLAAPLGYWLFAALLGLGGLYLLVLARPGHEHPWVDRFMRLASVALIVAAVQLAPRARPQGGAELAWQPYDDAAMQRALATGTPVVLDFYADWCVPCKELDDKTFSDPTVAAELSRFARFKVDLTRSEPRTEALRERYGVAGVPTIAFFSGAGELTAARLTGFEPPPAFLRRLERVTRR